MNRKFRFLILGSVTLLLLSSCGMVDPHVITSVEPTTIPSTSVTSITSETTIQPTSESTKTTASSSTTTRTSTTTATKPTTTTATSSKTSTTQSTSTTSSPVPSGYYASITDSMSGNTLKSNLKSIISKNVSTSYDWSRYEAADEDLNNSSNVLLIYARTSMAKNKHVSGSSGWNREHTFPQSKMETSQSKNDNHIIFASDNKVNGKRSNYRLGDFSDKSPNVEDSTGKMTPCKYYEKNGEKMFDPGDTQARGEVARATMYAATMYDYDIADNIESIALCLKWHLTYVVQQRDIKRNEVVYKNQKNRNPFVDHPEYACRIWGTTNSETRTICGM